MDEKPTDEQAQTSQSIDAKSTQDGVNQDSDGIDYAAEVAQRDARIEELEACLGDRDRELADKNQQVAGLQDELAAANASLEVSEAECETLRSEKAKLEEKAASDRIDFSLAMAGCRNVKAARAVLGDYNGDVGALKEAEPYLFASHGAEVPGATGLPNAGAASDGGGQYRHFRDVAGLAKKE